MDENRLASIEGKLDRLTDVVAKVAEQGATQAALIASHNRLEARVDTLHGDLYGRDGRAGLVHSVAKNKWITGGIVTVATLATSALVNIGLKQLLGG